MKQTQTNMGQIKRCTQGEERSANPLMHMGPEIGSEIQEENHQKSSAQKMQLQTLAESLQPQFSLFVPFSWNQRENVHVLISGTYEYALLHKI